MILRTTQSTCTHPQTHARTHPYATHLHNINDRQLAVSHSSAQHGALGHITRQRNDQSKSYHRRPISQYTWGTCQNIKLNSFQREYETCSPFPHRGAKRPWPTTLGTAAVIQPWWRCRSCWWRSRRRRSQSCPSVARTWTPSLSSSRNRAAWEWTQWSPATHTHTCTSIYFHVPIYLPFVLQRKVAKYYLGNKVENGIRENVECGAARDDKASPPPVVVLYTCAK